jgi:hypothetical protein
VAAAREAKSPYVFAEAALQMVTERDGARRLVL